MLQLSNSRLTRPLTSSGVGCSTTYTLKGETHSMTMLVRNIVLHLVRDLYNYESGVQQMVIEKMFGHELMKWMFSTFLSNLVETKHNHVIVEAIKSRVSTHITSVCTTKHNVAREFLGTLVTTTLVSSKDTSAKMVAKNHY